MSAALTSVAKNCNSVVDAFVENLKTRFPSVLSGIGRIKNYQLKLHINPAYQAVRSPGSIWGPRCVEIATRSAVQTESAAHQTL